MPKRNRLFSPPKRGGCCLVIQAPTHFPPSRLTPPSHLTCSGHSAQRSDLHLHHHRQSSTTNAESTTPDDDAHDHCENELQALVTDSRIFFHRLRRSGAPSLAPLNAFRRSQERERSTGGNFVHDIRLSEAIKAGKSAAQARLGQISLLGVKGNSASSCLSILKRPKVPRKFRLRPRRTRPQVSTLP